MRYAVMYAVYFSLLSLGFFMGAATDKSGTFSFTAATIAASLAGIAAGVAA